MLMSDYTAELLNLEDVIITNVENISDQLHIYMELPRTKHICPACGAVTDRIHDYRMQTVKDIPFARDTFLHLRKRRYRCSCGKRFFEKNPFLPRYYRVTSRLVARIIQEFKKIVPCDQQTGCTDHPGIQKDRSRNRDRQPLQCVCRYCHALFQLLYSKSKRAPGSSFSG